jgi:AraC-like DNA-binding protein
MNSLDYNECKIRGSFEFPIEFYHLEESSNQYTMTYHWHVEYEIIRILQGELLISLDGKEMKSVSGDVVFINSGVLHSGIPKNCVYECIVFDINMLLGSHDICKVQIQSFSSLSLIINNRFPKADFDFCKIVKKLFTAMSEKYFGYEFLVKGCLYQIFGTILQKEYYITNNLQTPQNHKRILKLKQVLELIEAEYSYTISLEQLSKSAGMSSKHFCLFFKEMTNKSPIDFLNQYRIEHACYQLENTDDSITTIAYNCGFNDLSYFIKTFKRYKGTTPKQYMKLR